MQCTCNNETYYYKFGESSTKSDKKVIRKQLSTLILERNCYSSVLFVLLSVSPFQGSKSLGLAAHPAEVADDSSTIIEKQRQPLTMISDCRAHNGLLGDLWNMAGEDRLNGDTLTMKSCWTKWRNQRCFGFPFLSRPGRLWWIHLLKVSDRHNDWEKIPRENDDLLSQQSFQELFF